MKKSLPTLSLLLACAVAQAAPFVDFAPRPSTGPQPNRASITINGGAAQACTMRTLADGAVQASCDLVSITNPGTYTILGTEVADAGCVNGLNTATCNAGGTVVSDPFVYVRKGGLVAKPALSMRP